MSHYFRSTLKLHNLPVDSIRELFKPSKDAASLVDYKGKIFYPLGFMWVMS